MGQKPDSARNFEASNGGVMELKTTADRREYLYAQAWVDEPASGMDVINLLSDLTAALARVEELEKENAKLLGYANQCRMDTDKVERELRGMYNEKMRHLRTQTRTVCPWPDDKKCPEGGSCDACIKGIAVELAASQRQVAKMAREMVSCGCPGCPLELTCECQGGAGVDCVAKVEEWAKGDI